MEAGAALSDLTRLEPHAFAQPWLAPYAERAKPVLARLLQGANVAQALAAEAAGFAGTGIGFVAPERPRPGEAYESFIARTGTVPTRDNLHDLFNGLVWLTFPQAKRRLNELQAGEIARVGVGPTRGPLRDALTLFDENGAVLEAPPPLWDALLARDWRRLFVTERARWREARLLVFGHALLEKLVYARKTATAHVLLAGAAINSIANEDAAVTAALDPAWLVHKPFAPLPVLGVPLWWPQNASPAFYDDPAVFRPPAPRRAA